MDAIVLVAITRFLTRDDLIQWLLLAVETIDSDLLRMLLYQSAYPLAHGTAHIVHSAVATGSFVALAALLSSHQRPHLSNARNARKFVFSHCYRGFPEWVLHGVIRKIQNEQDVLAVVQSLVPRITYYDAPKTMTLAATCRRLAVAQWIAEEHNSRNPGYPKLLEVIVPVDDSVHVLHWLENYSSERHGMLAWCRFASRVHGAAPVGQAICYVPVPLYPAIDYAASIGDLDLLQTLHNDTRVAWPCSTDAMDHAATRGDMAMVQWLHLNRSEGCSPAAMDGAATRGHYEMVRWLYLIRNARGTAKAFDSAAVNGHIQILKWQRAKFPHFDVSTTALEDAARGGFLAVIQWVDETTARVRVTPTMMQHAVTGGQLDVAQ